MTAAWRKFLYFKRRCLPAVWKIVNRVIGSPLTKLVHWSREIVMKVTWIQVLLWDVVRICQILLYTLK